MRGTQMLTSLAALLGCLALFSIFAASAQGTHLGGDDDFVFEGFLFAGPVTTAADGSFAVAVEARDVWLFDGLVLDAQDDLGEIDLYRYGRHRSIL